MNETPLTDAQCDAIRAAYHAVIKQGEPSYTLNSCLYKCEKNGKVLHCAVGHLFSKDFDNWAQIEQGGITSGSRAGLALKEDRPELFTMDDAPFFRRLHELQEAHDTAADYGDLFVERFIQNCSETGYLCTIVAPIDE
jgi:hypothetical protein